MYTWGWSECIPSMKTLRDLAIGGAMLKDSTGKQTLPTTEQGNFQVLVKMGRGVSKTNRLYVFLILLSWILI